VSAPLLVDTGPIVALLSRTDRHHRVMVDTWKSLDDDLVSTEAVLTELTFLLAHDAGAQQACLDLVVSGVIRLAPSDPELVARIAALMERYANVPMDFADATLVAQGERLGIARILTLDSDFSIYRLGRNRPFTILP
jgi:hypothetical protein